jgi:hypothetical protein
VQVPDIDLRDLAFCKICGQPFSILSTITFKTGKSIQRRYTRRAFCSDDCAVQGNRANVKQWKRKNPQPHERVKHRAEMVACVCPRCGKKHKKEGPTDWRRYCPACDTAICTGMIDMDLENDCREYVNG